MRNRKSFWLGAALLALAPLSGGCIDGVALGVQSGVESAISTTIETIVTQLLEPLLNVGGGE